MCWHVVISVVGGDAADFKSYFHLFTEHKTGVTTDSACLTQFRVKTQKVEQTVIA